MARHRASEEPPSHILALALGQSRALTFTQALYTGADGTVRPTSPDPTPKRAFWSRETLPKYGVPHSYFGAQYGLLGRDLVFLAWGKPQFQEPGPRELDKREHGEGGMLRWLTPGRGSDRPGGECLGRGVITVMFTVMITAMITVIVSVIIGHPICAWCVRYLRLI